MSYKVKDIIKLYPQWKVVKRGELTFTHKSVDFIDKNVVEAIMNCEPLTEIESEAEGIIVIVE